MTGAEDECKKNNLKNARCEGHLLGVGPVPEDGEAVGHRFGTGLLAIYTHQQHQAEEDDHFHLQHHYSETSARIPLRCRSVSRVLDTRRRALQLGQVMGVPFTCVGTPVQFVKDQRITTTTTTQCCAQRGEKKGRREREREEKRRKKART